jgi:signal-transduction protein with cAMP-binding, CBS, and nucleotidyltransferase domain
MATVKHVERTVRRVGRVLAVGADSTATEAAKVMCDNRVGSVIVADEHDHLVGILTERDVISHVVAKTRDPSTTRVRDIMTKHVISCSFETDVASAQKLMAEHEIRHLPIVEQHKPVGMISSRDIMAHQLSTTRAIAARQSRVLKDIERTYPGITEIKRTREGRIVLDEADCFPQGLPPLT